MRKFLVTILVMSIVLISVLPVSAQASDNKNDIEIKSVKGISRTLSSEASIVKSDSDFNFLLDKVAIEINRDTAKIETNIGESNLMFTPTLHQSQLGYNASNTLFGITSEISEGFRLTKFTIEKSADPFSLLAPNQDMAGNTVVTLAFLNLRSEQTYYFQFTANDLSLPTGLVANDKLSDYELANFGAQPYEVIKADIDSLKAEVTEQINISEDKFSQSTDSQEKKATEPLATSAESKLFDRLLEVSKNGPIQLNSISPFALVPNIPDYVYKSQTYGWEHKNQEYQNEGANAARAIGYSIFHMPDSTTGNVMNYVLRFESVVNYNWSSQQFVHSFLITHNLWVQYNKYQDTAFIFDDRAWNARIQVEAESRLETKTTNGYFTHCETSGIQSGSFAKNIIKAILIWVPKLGDVTSTTDMLKSGTKIKTGGLHPTDRFAKNINISLDKLKEPGDHVIVKGLGSSIENISFGYSLNLTSN
jgi:hypothetical protein